MDFFDWQGTRRRHGTRHGNNEQRRQTEKVAIHGMCQGGMGSGYQPLLPEKAEQIALYAGQYCVYIERTTGKDAYAVVRRPFFLHDDGTTILNPTFMCTGFAI